VAEGRLRALLSFVRPEGADVVGCTAEEGVALAIRGELRLYATDEALAHAAAEPAKAAPAVARAARARCTERHPLPPCQPAASSCGARRRTARAGKRPANSSGCRISARISRLSTRRGPGRLR